MPARSLLAMLIVVLAQVIYQLAQKAMPSDVQPFAALTLVYALATAACLLVLLVSGAGPVLEALRVCFVAPSVLLAIAVIGIEVGFLALYRSGGAISTAYATSSAATILILFLIGALWMREPVNTRQLAGVLLAAAGVWLATSSR